MSGGGFLRRGPDSSSSYSSSYSGGQSRTDEPEQTPQQRDEQKARGELMRAHQLAADAKKLDDVPAAAWEETRDQLAAKVEAFAAGLRSPSAAGFAPSDNADQDRAATIAAVEKARTTIKHAKRPRNVPAVAGEEEIEPRIADKSIAPEDVIDWMAGLSKSERAAVWRRYTEAANSRADTFAVALANYIARHRDRSPPLATDLHALATMDARRFAEWRELSGRGPQIGQSTPTTEPAQSRPLDPAGQSFADPARDQDHDGRADLLSGQRETPPPPEQTQADATATRAGVDQAIAALGDTAGQVLPAYDDAIGALNPAAAYQLQARALFVFRQAVSFRTQLRTMGGTEALAQLERAINTAGAELTRRVTARELHGRPVLPAVPALDLSTTKDPAALLQHDAEIAIQLIDAAHQVAARLSPESADNATSASTTDAAAAQEAAALVHPFRTRPLSFAFLRALLTERGLWPQIERAPLRFENGLPMMRTLADDARAADAQAAEFGAEVDLGGFSLARAEELLQANAADTTTDAVDNPEEQTDPGGRQRTKRAREVGAMLAPLINAARRAEDGTNAGAARSASVALGRILEALNRRGLLGEYVSNLAPNEVALLYERLPVGGLGGIKTEMRPLFEDRDTTNRSVSHYLGKVPGVGGVLKFLGNVATGGFLDEHDQKYAAMKRGDITDGEYDAATNHAATRALATVAVSGYVGGGAGAYVEGMTAEMAASSTVGRYAARTFTGAAEGFAGGLGAQAGADLVDQHFSGFGAYGKAGMYGAGLGAGISVVAGVGAEGAKFLPPGVQTIAQKLYGLFPHHADVFDGIRAAGAEHAATIRIKVARLLQLGDDLHLPGARPSLALASADGGPRLTPDDEVIVTVKATRPLDEPGNLDGPAPIAILKAERLPEKAASTPGDGLDGGPVSTAGDDAADGLAFLDDNASRADDLASATSKTADDEIATVARAAAARARIVQAIGDVPISSTPSTKGRPSYFITRTDGAELQRLLAQLPEVRVTEFPRGLTIHRDGSDWFLEWMPEQGAPAHALAADRTGGSVGLPPSNASIVQFYGFRGINKVDGVYWKKLPPERLQQVMRELENDPLLHYGHVGVSFDGGRTIHGLTPNSQNMAAEELLAKVLNHEPLPAVVQDDTATFTRAQALTAEGWDLSITTAALSMDDAARVAAFGENARLEAKSLAGQPTGKDYQFPYEEPNALGSHYANNQSRNCATYPQMLGLCVPEPSGQLRDYIPELKKWNNRSPVDLLDEKKKTP